MHCFSSTTLATRPSPANGGPTGSSTGPERNGLVRQELNRLGVSPENIDQAMGGFDDEANAYREGFKLSRRLTARGVVGEDFNRRVGVRLKLRGFSYSVIRETLRKLRDEES